MPRFDYHGLAKAAIVDLVRAEYAVTIAEMEAKISDHVYPGMPRALQPHVLTTARQELVSERRIASTTEATRGGHRVTVFHLADDKGIRSAIRSAAERKRALTGTLQSWATATKSRPEGLLGPGGEQVVLDSARTASIGALLNPDTGGINRPLGHDIGGAVDNGIWVPILDERGLPAATALALIEVKNVRHWLYPWHPETYQLLYKAARLQQLEPALSIVPTLICRARQFQLDRMSRQLGFRVVNTRKQYLAPDQAIGEGQLASIRAELGFDFLEVADGADRDLVRALRLLPREGINIAPTWKAVGAKFADSYEALRKETLKGARRSAELDDLRELVKKHTGSEVDW